ncbi:MAG: hypothetical protein QME61_00285 [Patescibacteria group bacterium]|nr:hypothetical protein [Patescibacteria group bacterium]
MEGVIEIVRKELDKTVPTLKEKQLNRAKNEMIEVMAELERVCSENSLFPEEVALLLRDAEKSNPEEFIFVGNRIYLTNKEQQRIITKITKEGEVLKELKEWEEMAKKWATVREWRCEVVSPPPEWLNKEQSEEGEIPELNRSPRGFSKRGLEKGGRYGEVW